MMISFSFTEIEGGLTVLRAQLLAAALQSAARCWNIACDRRSLAVLTPLPVHTHYTHTYTHTYTPTCMLLLPPAPPAHVLLCGLCLPTSLQQGTSVHTSNLKFAQSMTSFIVRLTSRAGMLLKSQF
ncbi:hypothetical protein AMECASPLE_005064 [Ameca splendens]|uniref:Secreted protein n=1 Tax=Ameca splendens TaxID=208324 RepID=A0ABV0YA78_9TELE